MEKSQLADAYRRAENRLLLLDYDGVLAPITRLPEEAYPRPETLALLEKLTADTRNTCVIVSGRHHRVLDDWLGRLPLDFAAEHGAQRRLAGGAWEMTGALPDDSWKVEVQDVMRRYAEALDGAFTEEKPAAVGLHYRAVADQTKAAAAMDELCSRLEPLARRRSLRVLHGKKVVEVVPATVDKGSAATFWLNQKQWPFILAAGDDVTDEALFAAVPSEAWSVKVGDGPTAARLSVGTQAEFIALLESLVVL
jgi:trehalose 6-phosphate synthase/phosphatase